MIIGIDASRANDEKKTGVSWYAYFLIQELKKVESRKSKVESCKTDIEFVLYTDKPLQGELADLPEDWSEKVLNWPPKRLWTQVRLSWEMLVNPPDVLFIPAHVFPIIHPKKTVMTVHDVAALKFPESYNWFERWYSIWSARTALKKLWRIITPSEFTKDELRGVGNTCMHCKSMRCRQGELGMDKVHVIKHGYNKNYRKIKDEGRVKEVLEKYGLKKPFVMSIGRLEEKKNTVRIIEAFEKLGDEERGTRDGLKLLLVGKPGYGYEKVEQAIKNSKFKKDIITPGWIDQEDIPILMNAAEVFVFPSLYEGFGLPVLESMACGTPVVASKGNSLEEVGGDACVYVKPDEVDEIVDAIVELTSNIEQRTTNIEKGLERVKDFSWEKCARETLQILID